MKLLLFLFLSILSFSQGCRGQKDQPATAVAGLPPAAPAEDTLEAGKALEEFERLDQEDPPVISVEKTFCFGACPVFMLKIFENGYLFYEGIANVDRIGRFYGHVSDADIREIQDRAVEIGFFEMNDDYDHPQVTDLPSATYMIREGDRLKKVHNRYQGPEALKTLDNSIQSLLDRIPLKSLPAPSEP